ncbi:cupin domain-containing protein [Mesorhizobium erdmanii]|uniref:Cupin domain-containing protein n=1 Tax=Mesorhizobium erdmanii TaxID=1777866 RepID=A0A6M7UGM7_9HYPH|nr:MULTISPECIES: cupin domain-containing protein [Mesorhizobium]QKC75916.1 cupin domain-containing protein [Mesorhizobium erdmanii]
MESNLIDLSTFHDLAETDIGAFSPKPTSIEGNQVEAARSLFQSPDGTVDIGIWECTPGRFTADRSGSSEICHIISGRVEVSRADGEVRELGPGDLLVLPQGWKGEWRIRETTRKLYMIQSAG